MRYIKDITLGARNDRGVSKAPRVAKYNRLLVSEIPNSLEHSRNFSISCGRKFKDLYDRVKRDSPAFSDLVSWETTVRIVCLVLVAGTMWLVYRLALNHRKRVLKRISNVIKISETYLVSKTRIKVQYSTEYSSLTLDTVGDLFDKGCVVLRRDGRTPNEPSFELTSKSWKETILVDNNRLIDQNVPISATWHAIWNQPPPVDVGLWDVQSKTQKMSYDVISLDRSSENRRKIEYHCVADHGLSSGWIKFFYEVNDGIPNFLRGWTDSRFKKLVPGHLIMYPPKCWVPILVPCPVEHKSNYREMHRVRLIADKIAITMRTDGSWNENIFLATYRNTVSGNTQISIGHQLSDVAMNSYLPLVRQLVRANRTFGDRE